MRTIASVRGDVATRTRIVRPVVVTVCQAHGSKGDAAIARKSMRGVYGIAPSHDTVRPSMGSDRRMRAENWTPEPPARLPRRASRRRGAAWARAYDPTSWPAALTCALPARTARTRTWTGAPRGTQSVSKSNSTGSPSRQRYAMSARVQPAASGAQPRLRVGERRGAREREGDERAGERTVHPREHTQIGRRSRRRRRRLTGAGDAGHGPPRDEVLCQRREGNRRGVAGRAPGPAAAAGAGRPGASISEGGLHDAMRACLHSRIAMRVLWELATFTATDADDLYAGMCTVAWHEHLTASHTLAVRATCAHSALSHTQFIALRTKDAVVHAPRYCTGVRPDVNTQDPRCHHRPGGARRGHRLPRPLGRAPPPPRVPHRGHRRDPQGDPRRRRRRPLRLAPRRPLPRPPRRLRASPSSTPCGPTSRPAPAAPSASMLAPLPGRAPRTSGGAGSSEVSARRRRRSSTPPSSRATTTRAPSPSPGTTPSGRAWRASSRCARPSAQAPGGDGRGLRGERPALRRSPRDDAAPASRASSASSARRCGACTGTRCRSCRATSCSGATSGCARPTSTPSSTARSSAACTATSSPERADGFRARVRCARVRAHRMNFRPYALALCAATTLLACGEDPP